MALLALFAGAPAVFAAVTPVGLGTAQAYAVLAGSTVTNTGTSQIIGDLGVSPGTAVVGFPPGEVQNGVTHAGDANAAIAQDDLTTAYTTARNESPPADVGPDLVGQTLTAGVYQNTAGAGRGPLELSGTLTLDGQGNPDGLFVFQTDSTLITADESQILMINGANPCNVFWQVGSSATLGTYSGFQGNILALTSITLDTNADVVGRLLARNGAVTLDSNNVRAGRCGAGTTSTESPSGTGTGTGAGTVPSGHPATGEGGSVSSGGRALLVGGGVSLLGGVAAGGYAFRRRYVPEHSVR